MAAAEQNIAVDSDISDDSESSLYQSGSEYSTTSLSSSIYDYRYENGRRYHAYKDGQYAFPNDEKEQNRLDIIHHVYLLMLDDKLHLAPIGDNPQRILDIGTGTGIWAIDMGERYPSAEVVGTDLSPIQPSWVPPNVQFQIDDAECEWTFAKDSFDLIHIRHLTGAIQDWPALIKQAFQHVRPGGFIEFAEYEMDLYSDDGSFHSGLYLWKFYDLVKKAAKKHGREFNVTTKLKGMLEDAGFEDIHYETIKLPLGTWPADKKQKEKGAYLLLNAETAFDAFGTGLFTRELGMTVDEANEIVEGAGRDSKNRKIHAYNIQHLFYARKPLEDC